MRPTYRARQFWLALNGEPDSAHLTRAQSVLSPAQMALFARMQPSEQAHALSVMDKLLAQGEQHPDLLVAALLHDVGKQRYPLRPWERVMIVLGKVIFPQLTRRWRASVDTDLDSLPVYQRPFVVAGQHPAWGAAMAKDAGVSPLALALIQNHQEPVPAASESLADSLLRKLQAVDDES